MGKPFTAEQDEWLRKHHSPDRICRDLTDEYNAFWGENRTLDTMKHHCKKLGLVQRKNQRFTPEQDAWLIERQRQYSIHDLTQLFNQTFDIDRSEQVIKVHCNRVLGTRFRNDKSQEGMPIGSETIRGGFIWVKVSNTAKCSNSAYKNWKQKSHIVWEQHYGCMPPKGHTIIFLDGNRQNCDINNLYAVSGKVLREMSKKSWWRSDPEFTLTAIRWCELHYAIKGVINSGCQ